MKLAQVGETHGPKFLSCYASDTFGILMCKNVADYVCLKTPRNAIGVMVGISDFI